MKKFSAFLSEAQKNQAQKQAKALGLVHQGYGYYGTPQGDVTHRSRDGQLVQLSPDEVKKSAAQQPDEEPETQEQDAPVSIAITFGRFNPPTIGHEKLINKVATEARGGEYRIYPSQTQDDTKNPLSANEKVDFMAAAYPKHADAIVNSSKLRTIFDVLTSLNEDGYTEVKIVVGGDRVAEFNSLAQKYNGKLYDFENILVVSAGDRDPDADDVSGMSASKMRSAAAEGDFDTFAKGIPDAMSKDDKESLFKAVRSGMKLNNEEFDDFTDASYNLHEIAPKLDQTSLRESYLNKEIFKVGTFVENLNSGIIGKIVSRGSNHVIYIDEHDTVYRAWLKDLAERNILDFGFDYTPAGEVGTDALTDYMVKLTPGEFIKKINKRSKRQSKDQ